MKFMNKCQTIERFRIFHIFHLRLSEAGEAWQRPRRGLASEAKRICTKAKRTSLGLEAIYIILVLESQQGSTPNEFGTLLPCQNFKPQLAHSRQASSFRAMEIVVKRKFLKMKQGWTQASKQLEAGLEAGPGGLGYRH